MALFSVPLRSSVVGLVESVLGVEGVEGVEGELRLERLPREKRDALNLLPVEWSGVSDTS